MNKIILLLCLLCHFLTVNAQTITGRLVDHNGTELPGVRLQLYIAQNTYEATSDINGYFTFNNVLVGISEEEKLPAGYAVSDNYPNPFNPKTRIEFSLPENGNIRINVFNILGQNVIEEIDKNVTGGSSFADLELNGLPNGFYFARVVMNGKYTVTKKLILMYGSRHLSASSVLPNLHLNKSNKANKTSLVLYLDSLVASNVIIGRKTFKNLPAMESSTLNLGDMAINRYCQGIPTVAHAGKTYNTVQIGTQCWLKENLDIGNMINTSANASNNGTVEKYCYNNVAANCDKYGGFYQWNEAMAYVITPGAKGICPDGWHIPIRDEFLTLDITVNSDGNSLKAKQGFWSASGITNASGFSAIFTGNRSDDSNFFFLGTYFWASSSYLADAAIYSMYDFSNTAYLEKTTKPHGFSIRCLKN